MVISVLDDGPGVPEALRERIFEPFVTDKEQGAGLGLAIVRKVAEAHGGRVEVRGRRGNEWWEGCGVPGIFRQFLEDPPVPTPVG